MLYFKRNDDLIEKYNVDFDSKEIEKLKNEIIKDCSFINHKEYQSDCEPRLDNKIKNYKSTFVGNKDYFEETRDVYLYSYDEYEPPYLVELIDKLLKQDSKVIDKILNYDISSDLSIDDKINLVNQEFINIDPDDTSKRKLKLKELQNLLETRDLNKQQKSIDSYYNKLMGLIKFELVDKILFSELKSIESFLETKITNKVVISDSKEKKLVKSLEKSNN